MMIAINTMARQAQKMLEELTQKDKVQEQTAQEMEELRYTMQQLQEKVKRKDKEIHNLRQEKTQLQLDMQ